MTVPNGDMVLPNGGFGTVISGGRLCYDFSLLVKNTVLAQVQAGIEDVIRVQ